MQTKIIVNPVAGQGTSLDLLPKVKKCLDAEGIKYSIVRTSFPGHATQLAEELETRDTKMVAMGGDGTVREVLNGIRLPTTPVGVIPAGMGNDFARSLGIPRKASRAAHLLVDHGTKKVDLGAERGKFFNVMGAGFPSHVVERINRYKKMPLSGPLTYLLGLLRSVTNLENYRFLLELDGVARTLKANAIFVTNSIYTAGGLKLVPQAKMDDGLLDIVIVSGAGKMELLLALRRAYRGDHVDHPKIEFLKAEKVRIDSETELIKMFDGELEGTTPAELEIIPETRTIIVPP